MPYAFRSLPLLLGFSLFPGPAAAQEPKVGQVWYEDSVDLGFKLKVPKGWDFIPPQPLETNLIGKYAPPNSQSVHIGGGNFMALNTWLLRFDPVPEDAASEDDDDESEDGGPSPDMHTWIEDRVATGSPWQYDPKKYPKRIKGPKLERVEDCEECGGEGAQYFIYEGLLTETRNGTDPIPIKAYVAVFHLSTEVHLGFMGVGPGDRKWRTYEKAYASMAKSLQRVEVERLSPASGNELASPRARKRVRLAEEVAKNPGWELHETESYFIISSYNDKEFIADLKEQLEAIRSVYVEHYPPESARPIPVKPDEDEEEEGDDDPAKQASDKGVEEPPADDSAKDSAAEESPRSFSTINPMERSRSSVVRVCKDINEFRQYAPDAPRGTVGYFHPAAEELVIFDAKKSMGRDFTWLVMYHEAFHQYIYYFYGEFSPHSWYNEGTGDYYSGFEYEHRKFKEKANNRRLRTIQQMIREERFVPLDEFVRWTKKQYYGENDLKLQGHLCYAQGWSLIWFLRTGEKNKARGWRDEWNAILPTYLDTYGETGDIDVAVDKAFEKLDWKAFEKCWQGYIGG